MNERAERWDRVALVAVIVFIMILLIGWIQYNFGISTAAWALGGIFTTALIAGTAIFVQRLNHTSQVNTADLLHEFGSAQVSGYKVLEQQLRADRDKMRAVRDRMRLEDKAQQLEAKQTGGERMVDSPASQDSYGPVYVD